MLLNIGSTDAELRDDLIYTTLSHWIPGESLTVDELQQLLPVILDDQHLQFKSGETATDSVFTRSFSLLVLPLLFTRHRQSPFLTSRQIHQIKDKVLDSILAERDYRGYDEDKGWAHAIAHGADVLDELAQCPELDYDDLVNILDVVQAKVTITERIYSDGEDERLVRPIISVLNRQLLSQAYVEQWIQGFGEAEKSPDFLPAFRQRYNIKNFLKSLYFRVKYYKTDAGLCPVIENTLYKVETVYYASR
ncbi:DUF2785 domain-containing protein [Paenibacillus sp. MMS20-IR301]|uniref:DUF2785 domain-containing protein n=1 Tax=Paenibacillus sp. MMS20-IR301 TaxID=2895946 RepID=UPI0028E691DB|nr:DUF2785 domain-containing protein [Paenibacillus sp. MMS20-IR301]WNS42873.1 DUF2785 domain-containing protein [Paenibacillus sp. MMS20-IR301]